MDIEKICDIAVRAGREIMKIRVSADIAIENKIDNSPVTRADIASHNIIINELIVDEPVISEEGKIIPVSGDFWLVDPLDGTKAFIEGSDEFTVNIAFIKNNLPILGVIYLPATNILYAGDVNLSKAWMVSEGVKTFLPMQQKNSNSYNILMSRHHTSDKLQNFLQPLGRYEAVGASSSYKFCLIAQGVADLYPRLGNTMEWDIAAGHAIVKASGGEVFSLESSPSDDKFIYGKIHGNKPFLNGGFIACSADNLSVANDLLKNALQ